MAYEIEVEGGLIARYLRRFPRRRFSTLAAAGAYAARIRDITDANGTTACHRIWVWDRNHQDVTRAAFDTVA